MNQDQERRLEELRAVMNRRMAIGMGFVGLYSAWRGLSLSLNQGPGGDYDYHKLVEPAVEDAMKRDSHLDKGELRAAYTEQATAVETAERRGAQINTVFMAAVMEYFYRRHRKQGAALRGP